MTVEIDRIRRGRAIEVRLKTSCKHLAVMNHDVHCRGVVTCDLTPDSAHIYHDPTLPSIVSPTTFPDDSTKSRTSRELGLPH